MLVQCSRLELLNFLWISFDQDKLFKYALVWDGLYRGALYQVVYVDLVGTAAYSNRPT